MAAALSRMMRKIKRAFGSAGQKEPKYAFGEQDLSSPSNIPFDAYADALSGGRDEEERRRAEVAVLSDLAPYIHRFAGREDRTLSIGSQEAAAIWNRLGDLFCIIDPEAIFSPLNKKMGFDHKAAILDKFYGKQPPFLKVYVRRVNLEKKRLRCQAFVEMPHALLDGVEMKSLPKKQSIRRMLGEDFCYTQEFIVPYGSDGQTLSFSVDDGRAVILDVDGKEFDGAVPVADILSAFTAKWDRYPQEENTWLIMDRDVCADDNGEHFYRYMMNHHPEQRCVFALRKTSVHWDRLKKEGFHLVDFGSPEYEREACACSMIISSHADPYVFSYYRDHFFFSKKFVFLQHGVTKDDISPWLNTIREIDLMVAASVRERDSIVEEGGPYRLLPEEVGLTGFPRHDLLLRKASALAENPNGPKTILVMPTWRQDLLGKVSGKGNARDLLDHFSESQFAKAWSAFLNSPRLEKLAKKGFRVVFFPHANLVPYIESGQFSFPSYVEYASNMTGESIQDIFANSSLLVTDYSSAAFELAYIERPCIYYHFESGQNDGSGYHFCKGYFDYEKDGFGPIARSEEELFALLESWEADGCEVEPEFRARMAQTFPYRDGLCCERAYRAILELG
ncbi:CDP-glycerol glycerophosphotransferase family protein [Parvibacter caecicola]|uniref:CDP-glycerol glycerophosphotransferase (TagB/SpsB family) n=1 Tax=Parvibacter caecicola TaxID=747645 RepID=A0A7W5D2Y5_9ACTN|nr:CDP-glycerol glycerophosphotransferase family protein [Parvibacter caecicola]MBB3171205.1 CDP-glycerol glycerophosphotransferase (TagB/SpsB family) [Parvibacter caecicola]MCR2042003.1 CDP-glycerol glycerophosphotransferase family protein [Parvibacter caecicola]RNL11392.1 hypothetical protein DMP11_03215 [Parvibacter caecicola]